MPSDQPIAGLLRQPDRDWKPNPPASEEEIARLRAAVRFQLPAEYIELLRFCNGGHGEVDAPPLLFFMDSIAEALEHNKVWNSEGRYLDFWFFGGNGGLETLGFDLRVGPPHPIIMIDTIAGEESAEQIADSMADFIPKMGLASDRPDHDQPL
ncbi:MAG TPA: SMI1/KNR4 family protein [Phycisphaerae bacterium]|jgi:hypothetical protein|nr:SMI1/KNR4 family protein [Phycisphaerae bacterium]HOB76109.1 SMI1/KNR4 family protein [Phycisphaerae bacterium]HOJ56034.1 SMI1/KNR4 family protein [Phycisphaerae bacterium]HOL27097.1 SMI1/KNR4 family protein [Phycisphaerae bacterium]HPP21229.1 SMI1/KNR4 family protein [Phycisphaerae bacterium]